METASNRFVANGLCDTIARSHDFSSTVCLIWFELNFGVSFAVLCRFVSTIVHRRLRRRRSILQNIPEHKSLLSMSTSKN